MLAGESKLTIARAAGYCYCDIMKNITVSVDDATYRKARIAAAERDTSVSALVKQFLTALARDEASDFARLADAEREMRERVQSFRAADRVPRDELYDRAG